MTKYEVMEVEVGEEVNITERDVIIGAIDKSGTTYLVYLRIKAGART